MKRPAGIDPDDITTENTLGGELMYADNLQEYFGEYHLYPNRAAYSDPQYNPKTSKQLLPLIKPLQNPICQTYLKLSRKLYSQYRPPTQHFKIVYPEDYQTGKMLRFIIQKINEPWKIFEVDIDSWKSVNRLNKPGINAFIYRRDIIRWTLTGNVKHILKQNSNALQQMEKSIPGISSYLLTNPLEFAKIEYTGPVNGLFTAGGQYIDSAGVNYIGLYHKRFIGAKYTEAYEGIKEVSGINKKLFPV